MIDFARIFGLKSELLVSAWPFRNGDIVFVVQHPCPFFARVLGLPKAGRIPIRILNPLGLWFYQDLLPFLRGNRP